MRKWKVAMQMVEGGMRVERVGRRIKKQQSHGKQKNRTNYSTCAADGVLVGNHRHSKTLSIVSTYTTRGTVLLYAIKTFAGDFPRLFFRHVSSHPFLTLISPIVLRHAYCISLSAEDHHSASNAADNRPKHHTKRSVEQQASLAYCSIHTYGRNGELRSSNKVVALSIRVTGTLRCTQSAANVYTY